MTNITREDEFQLWLFDMPAALDEFLSSLPETVRTNMDYSAASLDVLETWLLNTYVESAAMLSPSQKYVVDGLARYIGETFRRELGGRWGIDFSDPKYVFYGLPQLHDFPGGLSRVCPHTLATAAANRRTGNYLRTVLDNKKQMLSATQSTPG